MGKHDRAKLAKVRGTHEAREVRPAHEADIITVKAVAPAPPAVAAPEAEPVAAVSAVAAAPAPGVATASVAASAAPESVIMAGSGPEIEPAPAFDPEAVFDPELAFGPEPTFDPEPVLASEPASEHASEPAPEPATTSAKAVGDTALFDALDLDDFDEAAAFVQHEDHDLWPEPEVVHEEQALDRTFSGEVAPRRRKRRKPTWKGFLRGLGRALLKILIWLAVLAVLALIVGTAVYMMGTETPYDQVFEVLGVFFSNLFT